MIGKERLDLTDLPEAITIGELKQMIEERTNTSVSSQKLIWKGKILSKHEATVASYIGDEALRPTSNTTTKIKVMLSKTHHQDQEKERKQKERREIQQQLQDMSSSEKQPTTTTTTAVSKPSRPDCDYCVQLVRGKEKMYVVLNIETTYNYVSQQVFNEWGIEPSNQRLIYKGKEIADKSRLVIPTNASTPPPVVIKLMVLSTVHHVELEELNVLLNQSVKARLEKWERTIQRWTVQKSKNAWNPTESLHETRQLQAEMEIQLNDIKDLCVPKTYASVLSSSVTRIEACLKSLKDLCKLELGVL